MTTRVDLATLRRMIRIGGTIRATIGLVMLLFPRVVGPTWVGPDATRGAVRLVIRALGIRELLIGAGAIIAAKEGRQLRRWVEFAMVTDGVDALATVAAARHIPTSRAVLVTACATGSAAISGWQLTQLPEEVPSTA